MRLRLGRVQAEDRIGTALAPAIRTGSVAAMKHRMHRARQWGCKMSLGMEQRQMERNLREWNPSERAMRMRCERMERKAAGVERGQKKRSYGMERPMKYAMVRGTQFGMQDVIGME